MLLKEVFALKGSLVPIGTSPSEPSLFSGGQMPKLADFTRKLPSTFRGHLSVKAFCSKALKSHEPHHLISKEG